MKPTMINDRTYYCSMKFKYVKVDIESNTTYNCHAAAPHPIDFNWLSSNSGSLFNTDINVNERTMMLRNERNASCEQNCWMAEDNLAVSPRIYQNGLEKTHIEVKTKPETIEFTSTSDCNLTCSYCTKEYSSAWRRDILKNGEYRIKNFTDSRYKLLPRDILLTKISQQTLKNSNRYKFLVEEIVKISDKNTHLVVTGGEPLLDINLINNLSMFSHCDRVEIFTGLGVSQSRFEKIVTQLKNYKNIEFIISGESTGDNYEFNRYGSSWDEFVNKVNYLQKHNFKFKFNCTLSNLTLLGFVDFADYFLNSCKKIPYVYQLVYQPNFMSPFVLDPTSKATIKSRLINSNNQFTELDRNHIIKSIEQDPDPQLVNSLSDFLLEFIARRPNLSLATFPESFVKWLNF